MYIAMNRFLIKNGKEELFEEIWKSRETHLDKTPGFKKFNLLKGINKDGTTLYASHTEWESKLHFENWTKSEAFRKAHRGASSNKDLYIGHPVFEGFDTII